MLQFLICCAIQTVHPTVCQQFSSLKEKALINQITGTFVITLTAAPLQTLCSSLQTQICNYSCRYCTVHRIQFHAFKPHAVWTWKWCTLCMQSITHSDMRPRLQGRRLGKTVIMMMMTVSVLDQQVLSPESTSLIPSKPSHTWTNLSSLTSSTHTYFLILQSPHFLSVSISPPQPNCLFVWHVQFQICWDSVSKNRCEGHGGSSAGEDE